MIRWMSAENYREQLPPHLWQKIATIFTFSLVPMLYFLPTVLGIILFAGLMVKFIAIRRHDNTLAISAAIMTIVIGGLIIYRHIFALGVSYSAVAFLATLSVGKLLEARNIRDVRALFLLQMLLMLSALMYSQAIIVFLYALFTLAMALRMLFFVEQRGMSYARFITWREIGKLFLLALPFAAVLFFLTPRVQPLWGIPRPPSNAITGLPDEMQLGDLTTLAKSNEIAFRVNFAEQRIPPKQALYWRGLTLTHFNGRTWTQDQRDNPPSRFDYNAAARYAYTLMPVKSELKWLTPLELPVSIPNGVKMNGNFQLSRPLLEKTLRYSFVSAVNYSFPQRLSTNQRAENVQIPPDYHMPQMRAFAARLYQQNNGDAAAFAAAFLRYLHDQPFYYSLDLPPNMGDVDAFFFQQRIGFCEHYANAMALAARAVGIPARVIIGYQGGELNRISGDWVVREEAAHAWVELWLAGRGWTRFDPTAAVSPSRITQGRLSENSLTSGADDRALGSRLADAVPALSWLRDAVDATQSFWQNWVIDLNRERQINLLNRLGLGRLSASGLIGMLLLSLLAVIGLLFWLWQRRPRADEDPTTRAIRQFLAHLARKGFIRATAESPAHFWRRLAQNNDLPAAQRDLLSALAQHYEGWRYRENENDTQLLSLIKRIRI